MADTVIDTYKQYGAIDKFNYKQLIFRWLDKMPQMVTKSQNLHYFIDIFKGLIYPYLPPDYIKELKETKKWRKNKLKKEKDDIKRDRIQHQYYVKIWQILIMALAHKGWLVSFGRRKTEKNIISIDKIRKDNE